MAKCDRCHKQTDVTIMSFFNTQIICMDCEEKECNHPQYEAARKAEEEQVRQGNYNFPGVGKPPDL